MVRIFKYRTTVEGEPLYATRGDIEHPMQKNEYPYEIPCTKKNLIDFILFLQAECYYTVTELRKKKVKELEEIAGIESRCYESGYESEHESNSLDES